MIYIGAEAGGGCGIYLDVHAIERVDQGQRVSGIIGDGHYEGEIQIALGHSFEVVFYDALMGDRAALASFLSRYGEENLCHDIEVALQERLYELMPSKSAYASRPHPYMPLFSGHGVVSERGV